MTPERAQLIEERRIVLEAAHAEYDRLKLDLAAAALRAEHPTCIAEKWAAAQVAFDQRRQAQPNPAERLLAQALERYRDALREFTDVVVRGLP